MRVKRHKKFQRSMTFFEQNFDFEEPYPILVDGTFANAVLANKVNMKEQLPKYFDGTCKLLTSPCVMIETEKLGPALYGAVQVLKSLQLQKCQHLATPIQASDCLKSLVGKPILKKSRKSSEPSTNFVVATQDANLRSDFRKVVGVPLLYLHGAAPVLEKPSNVNTKWALKMDRKKIETTGYQKEILQHMKSEVFPSNEGPSRKGTIKKRRAGPNPLSCKKAKKLRADPMPSQTGNSSNPSPEESNQKKKRKRIKVRLPKHVKELTQS